MSFSFLSGKSPFDEAEEKLEAGENPSGKPKLPTPTMGWQDVVFLIVLVGLVVGGYYYYQYAKKSSAETFAQCDVLYVAAETEPAKFIEAESCYNATWDLGFVSDSMEILRQDRLGAIEDKRNHLKDLFADAMDAIADRDSAKAFEIVNAYKGPMLLQKSDRETWESLAKAGALKAAVEAAAAPAADSAAQK